MSTTEYEIEREIVIDAPVEVVWRTVTEPDQITLWFADKVDLEVEPGAHGYMGFGEQGGPVVVEAVEPPTRFSFRWNHPAGEEPAAGQLAPGRVHPRRRRRAHPPPGHRERPRPARPGPTSTSSGTPTSTTTAGASSWTASPGCSPSARRDASRCGPSPTTSCGRRSPIPPVVGCSTSSSSAVRPAPARWPDQVPFTRQAVSKHLVVLEEAGLIGRRKQGREVLFRVDADRLDQATPGHGRGRPAVGPAARHHQAPRRGRPRRGQRTKATPSRGRTDRAPARPTTAPERSPPCRPLRSSSPEEWEAARLRLLVKEKELTKARDAMAAERRRMPWMAVEKAYEFEGPSGPASLLDLFEGRQQLIVYRAFLEPGVHGWPDHACVGCSMVADQVAHVAHLHARDTTLAFASRAPQADIQRVKARMGWEMPWYTMKDGFDADFGVDEWHGTNAFIRDGDRVFRTYFINARGDEALGSTWSYLDMTALGRQEEWEDSPGGLPAGAARTSGGRGTTRRRMPAGDRPGPRPAPHRRVDERREDVVIAHVGGLPVEELLPTLMSGVGAWLVLKLRVSRRGRR